MTRISKTTSSQLKQDLALRRMARQTYGAVHRCRKTYGHRGMVRKEISRGGAETQRIEYVWDSWNIIREIQVLGLG